MKLFRARGRKVAAALTAICLLAGIAGCESIWGSSNRDDLVTAIALSPDGQTLAIGYSNRKVNLYDPRTGRWIRTFEGKLPVQGGGVEALAFSPDGLELACGYREGGNIFDASTGDFKRYLQASISSLDYSRDGKLLATGGEEYRRDKEIWQVSVSIWDAKSGKRIRKLRGGMGGGARSVAFSPDGRILVAANNVYVYRNDEIKDLETAVVSSWDVGTGKLRWTGREQNSYSEAVAYAPGGATVAYFGKWIHLNDAKTGKLIRTLPNPRMLWPGAMIYAPDGKTLIVGTGNQYVELWDPSTGGLRQTFDANPGKTDPYHKELFQITAIDRSDDGQIIVTASNDYTVTVWDARTGTVLNTIGRKYVPPPHFS